MKRASPQKNLIYITGHKKKLQCLKMYTYLLNYKEMQGHDNKKYWESSYLWQVEKITDSGTTKSFFPILNNPS